ncbi:Ribokinase-like protein [Lophiostoma macrostomum CBS 122681]|uniref:Ribokinase-like protein n=1 Tax=Lophiostoma macrostomum CBS 122681 TaxID=1314788 RepID=A0A6A6T7Z0_9PLEO|nr:Ribokinase-like protein [Lophiostoma macrostomum CBS 122681]
MHHIVAVGAIYIDTILSVPHFPKEDTKLRASSLLRRRGGNCGNTFEVLEQLIQATASPLAANPLKLYLSSVLPSSASEATKFIKDSFSIVNLDPTCVYREEASEAASSYIIKNATKSTRTIVSYNELEEMSLDEFAVRVDTMMANTKEDDTVWYHFEGRVPDVTLACVKYLESRRKQRKTFISVELEKPERVGMKEVAQEADLVFYSKLWAEHHGFTSPRQFLEAQFPNTLPSVILCCTWGAEGAVAVRRFPSKDPEWVHVDGYRPDLPELRVIDSTIGAGDTFIAGMLFAFNQHADEWSLERKVNFANQLAGHKVYQEGFDNLALGMRDWLSQGN